ncbi:hypothetical protein vBBceSLY1_00014 [Bacillus phage vB_BceS_LY1]|uniref:Uncharacterized protein n=1 Tax=Bacillus phage vB_BceS_LY1 TaxID=2950459 RepID=A0AAE9LUM1_9CAUD|nr:hypothetical protein vBBceSLY1_00014 [Bacillus phage vB_BceS_LY1]
MNYTLDIHTITGEVFSASVAVLVDTVHARIEFIEKQIDDTNTVLVLDETEDNHEIFITLNQITAYVWKRR